MVSNTNTVIVGFGEHARTIRCLIGGRGTLWPLEKPVPEEFDVICGLARRRDRKQVHAMYRSRLKSLDFAQYRAHALHLFGRGVQLMPGTIVMPGVSIGENVLVNTGAQIDHDCIINDNCVISPGAILCGGVVLGYEVRIGAGAVVLQGVELPDGYTVEAGTIIHSSSDLRAPVRHVCNN